MAQKRGRLVVLIIIAAVLLAGVIWTFARRDNPLPRDPGAARIEQYRREGNISALAAELDNADVRTARKAVQALGHLGKEAVKHVERAIGDLRPQVREAAAAALGRLNDLNSAPLLAETVRSDKSANVRASAASALGRMYAHEQMEALLDAMGDSNTTVRRRAYAAYYRITGVGRDFDADDPLPKRRRALQDLREFWPTIKPYIIRYYQRKREKSNL